jgi:hypothetical protein
MRFPAFRGGDSILSEIRALKMRHVPVRFKSHERPLALNGLLAVMISRSHNQPLDDVFRARPIYRNRRRENPINGHVFKIDYLCMQKAAPSFRLSPAVCVIAQDFRNIGFPQMSFPYIFDRTFVNGMFLPSSLSSKLQIAQICIQSWATDKPTIFREFRKNLFEPISMNHRRVIWFEKPDAHINSPHRPRPKFIGHIPDSADFVTFSVVLHSFSGRVLVQKLGIVHRWVFE